MRTLPTNARLFLTLTYLAALLTAAWAFRTPLPAASPARGWEVALFLALAVFAYGKKIVLHGRTGDQDAGSLSLGFAITFAALLRFGPPGALVIGTLGCLVSCLYPRRQPGHQLAFNAAVAAVAAWLSGVTFLALNAHTLTLSADRSVPAAAAASLVYFAVNSVSTAAIIGLCSGQSIAVFWREHFLWTAPGDFAGAAIGTGAALLCGGRSWQMPLFVLPVILLTYQAYAVYAARARERQQHIESLADLYLGTIQSLALAIDAKDQHSHRHVLRVQRYAVATARHMGLPAGEMEALKTGALLHDIGKLGVPDYVLMKQGRLTDEEFAKIKKHPEIGAALLEGVTFPWPVLPVIRSHHEHWDGSGYPDGLRGQDIPLTARILAVADVYDSLTSSRSHRGAWGHEAALAELRRESGAKFDPAAVAAFDQIIGTLVAEDRAPEQDAGGEGSMEAGAGEIVHTADAVRQIQRASSELWALYEVAQTLSSSLGLQETLEILGSKLDAILPGTACVFLLRDSAGEALAARVAVGLNAARLRGARAASLTGRSQQVASLGESFRGGYDESDLRLADGMRLADAPGPPWQPLASSLIVAILHGGEALGTINLYHPEPDAFRPHDQQLLETIAERAALALYNGLLFDRTRARADTDPLTGLFNLRYLTGQIESLCTGGEPFALLCLDLDRFKPINDNFGHQKGDQVLCELADLFCGTVRESDVVARYGGDEFLVVLRGAGQAEARAMAQRLCEAVDAYDPDLTVGADSRLTLGVSVGAGCFPGDGLDGHALLAAADARMYRQKAQRKRPVPAAPLPDALDPALPDMALADAA